MMTSQVTHDDVSRSSTNSDSRNQEMQHGLWIPRDIPPIAYKCFKFFKADPIPGQKATWTKAERIEMDLSQDDLRDKVYKRAKKVSAAHQYQALPETRQAHVNQLIYEHRQMFPRGDWSCVYAKQKERATKARNPICEDYETVSMKVILMQRPSRTSRHPRTPMGELVDLRNFQASYTDTMSSTMEQPQMASPSNLSPPSDPCMEEPGIWQPIPIPDSGLGDGLHRFCSMTVDEVAQTQNDDVVTTETFDDFDESDFGSIFQPVTTNPSGLLDHALPNGSAEILPSHKRAEKRPRASSVDLAGSRPSGKKSHLHRQEERKTHCEACTSCIARMAGFEKTLNNHKRLLQMMTQDTYGPQRNIAQVSEER